jgi:phage terminase small subunit
VAKLTAKQKRFVEEYLIDLNASAAARRAGYSVKSAAVIGDENLRKPEIKAAIEDAQRALSERTQITQEMVLRRWWDIATADPNELIQYRRTNCRHCHGIEFEYQWLDRAEFQKALALAAAVEGATYESMPTDDGGYGFNKKANPHPDCPKCAGEGREDVFASDTRHLLGAARLLYAGVKITKDGLEIKLKDQDKALENVARHLGMFKDKVEHDITDDLAAAIIAGNARLNNGGQ